VERPPPDEQLPERDRAADRVEVGLRLDALADLVERDEAALDRDLREREVLLLARDALARRDLVRDRRRDRGRAHAARRALDGAAQGEVDVLRARRRLDRLRRVGRRPLERGALLVGDEAALAKRLPERLPRP